MMEELPYGRKSMSLESTRLDFNPNHLKKNFFLCGPFLKPFFESVTVLLLFYVLVFGPRSMWDLKSTTKDRTHTPCVGRQSPNPWTTREILPNH